MKQLFLGRKRILLFSPGRSAPGPATRMTKFTFIDGTTQEYDVRTINQQWLVQNSFCQILSPAEWVKTNQSDWNFHGQPVYNEDGNWYADFERNGDIGPATAEGDENATQLHFNDGVEIDVYAEKRSINWLKKIISIELGENVTVVESALEGLDLAPVYDGNGQRFSKWTILRDDEDVTAQVQQPVYIEDAGGWRIAESLVSGDDIDAGFASITQGYASESTGLAWTANQDAVIYTGTRTENSVIGYTHQSTIFTLEGGIVETHDITGTLDRQWMIDNGYMADDEETWLKTIAKADIGSTVTQIGDFAFYWCRFLTSVTIPNSVTVISLNAFNYCDSLTNVTIPDSVTSIDMDAFFGCPSLTNVTITANGGNANNVKQMMIDAIGNTSISDNITWNMPE